MPNMISFSASGDHGNLDGLADDDHSAYLLDGGAEIVNADINGSAAISYSKLNLATSILNADINGSAAIDESKLLFSGSGHAHTGTSDGSLLSKYQWGVDSSNAATETASTTYVLLPDTDVTLTINEGSEVLLLFTGAGYVYPGGAFTTALYRDGAAITNTEYYITTGASISTMAMSYLISDESAGAHTYAVYWKVNSNTGQCRIRRMIALELIP